MSCMSISRHLQRLSGIIQHLIISVRRVAQEKEAIPWGSKRQSHIIKLHVLIFYEAPTIIVRRQSFRRVSVHPRSVEVIPSTLLLHTLHRAGHSEGSNR